MALQITGLGHIPQRHLDASDLNASTSIIDMRHIPISVDLLQHLQQATLCDCASEAVAYTFKENHDYFSGHGCQYIICSLLVMHVASSTRELIPHLTVM